MSLPEVSGRKQRRLPAGWLWAVAAVLLAILLAYLFRAPLLTGVADLLIVNDTPAPADVIFLLNGDFNTRPFRAAELYHQGLAPKIVIARAEDSAAVREGLIPNDTDVSLRVLKRKGVPESAIVVLSFPGGVTSTFDEASALHEYVQTTSIRRILLVTSEFHRRRAKWIFARELKGLPVTLRMIAVPYSSFNRTNWWTNENGLITLDNEYIKLIFYYIKYR